MRDQTSRRPVIDGIIGTEGITMVELASGEHGVIAMRIGVAMANHAEAKHLGVVMAAGTGFVLDHDPDIVKAPDVAFVLAQRVPKEGFSNSKPVPFGPDIAVEVLSEGDSFIDVEDKIQPWLNAGARFVWVVDPRRKTVVSRTVSVGQKVLREGDRISAPEVLPGFELEVSALFA
jgi:Uma2 family endonuclease